MPAVTITVKKTGPYRVEGEINLVDHDGNPIAFNREKPVSLCRCGASATMPFCDKTHSKIGFLAAEQAQPEAETPRPAPG